MQLERIEIHGRDIGYRVAGTGPVVVLVHGMASSSASWERVMPLLAGRATVVAPDLLGHGSSSTSAGDYSLGALACGIRDLLTALGHNRATIVGHSLGGGVAMQFAYQFPHRCERIVLASSGGLGREVAFLLRALSVPGVEYLLPPAFGPRIHAAGTAVVGRLRRIGLRPAPSFEEIWRAYGSLGDAATRGAFFHTLRSVIDPSGQRVSATDRLHLMSMLPAMLVWGDRDSIIPVRHAYEAQAAMPGSVLHVLEGVGHFPQCDAPERFAESVTEFVATTPPAELTDERLAVPAS